MSLLIPKVFIDPDETLFSWLGRTAAIQADADPIRLLHDLGILPRDVEMGANDAIERLAQITGEEAERLSLNHTISVSNRRLRYRSEEFGFRFLSGAQKPVCPICLEEDGGVDPAVGFKSWRFKPLWQIRFCPVCPAHGTSLVNAYEKDAGYVPSQDLARSVGVRLPELIKAVRPRKISRLQGWIARRMLGRRDGSWLDKQDIDQAAKATEMLGVILAHGPKPDLNKMSEAGWDEAWEAGYEVTSRGTKAIKAALIDIIGRHRGKAQAHWTPRSHYGRLYEWLDSMTNSSHGVGPILEIFRDHIVDSYWVQKGRTILGLTVLKEADFTPRALALATGLDHRTAAHILEDCAAHGIARRHQIEALVAKYRKSIPECRLPSYLNCSRNQISALLEADVIRPIGLLGRCRLNSRYLTTDLDKALARLFDRSRPGSFPRNVVEVAKCANMARIPSAKIYHSILGRGLKEVYTNKEISGIRSILVCPEEVKKRLS